MINKQTLRFFGDVIKIPILFTFLGEGILKEPLRKRVRDKAGLSSGSN